MELALAYFIYLFITAAAIIIMKKKLKERFYVYVIAAAIIPPIGLLFMIAEIITRRDNEERLKDHMEQLDADIIASGVDDVESIIKFDELKVIPIQEALLVNDHFTRRRVMIDILKEDSLQYIQSLHLAVQNEDTETSHYAVSAITEIKRKLSIALQELSAAYNENPRDLETARSYAMVLKNYAASGYLDPGTLRAALLESIAIHSSILGHSSTEKNHSFEEKMEAEMVTEQYSEAEQTGLAYQAYAPSQEEPYLFLIKLYVKMRAYSRLQQVILELKKSDAVLTNQGLSVIRYWAKGEEADVS